MMSVPSRKSKVTCHLQPAGIRIYQSNVSEDATKLVARSKQSDTWEGKLSNAPPPGGWTASLDTDIKQATHCSGMISESTPFTQAVLRSGGTASWQSMKTDGDPSIMTTEETVFVSAL